MRRFQSDTNVCSGTRFPTTDAQRGCPMIIQRRIVGDVVRCAALVLATALPVAVPAQEFQDLKPSPPLVLRGEGSFFIDGYTQQIAAKYISPAAFASDAGNSMVNQMY